MNRRIGIALVLLLGILLLPDSAHAFQCPEGYAVSQPLPTDGVITKIVGCYRSMLDSSVYSYYTEIYYYLQYAIGAFLSLVIAVFGVSLASGGVERPARETFVLLLKIAGVIAFTENFFELYMAVTGALNNLLDTIASYITINRAFGCPTEYSLWQRADCVLDVLIGIKKDASVTKGITSLLTLLWKSGMFGILIAIIGGVMLFVLISSLAQAMVVYLISLTGIAFLSVFASMFIPMVTLRQTATIYQQWLRLIAGFIMQPVVMFVFMTMMFVVFDSVFYSGDQSLMHNIAGKAADDPNFSLYKYMIDNKIIDKRLLSADGDTNPAATAAGQKNHDSGMFGKVALVTEGLAAGALNKRAPKELFKIGVNYEAIHFCNMAKANPQYLPQNDCENQVPKILLTSMLFCAFVVFLLKGMLSLLPTLTGALGTPNMGADMQVPFVGRMLGGARSALGGILK